MKKTATVTWIKYHNFGTFLQAYALQQVILCQGYDNDILDDTSIREERKSGRGRLLRGIAGHLRSFLKRDDYFWIQRRADRYYWDFRKKYLKVNTRIQPLKSLNRKYDTFICGSDQIWYPSLNIYSPYYYLSFAEKRKVAYAPSIGTIDYPAEFVPKVRPLLEKFDNLSVREKQGAEILSTMLGREVGSVLDPTLLLEGESWKIFVKDVSPVKEKYILCYFLTPNRWYMEYVQEFARRMDLPVKIFCTQRCYLDWADIVTAGPEEFLDYIWHSDYFFTDSFHGSIFSILFEKRFCTFKRFADTSKLNQNSRVTHLFALLGLEDYFISESRIGEVESLSVIDWSRVKEKLDVYRRQSLDYLTNALKD